MAEVIYKHVKINKTEFYQWMIDELVKCGWKNVSSRSADFDVFHSKGISGEDDLYFQMKEYNSNPSNKISNSVYASMFIKPLYSYTPSGANGGAGTFLPASAYFQQFRILYDAVYKELPIDIYYSCDADKFTAIVEAPEFLEWGALYFYIGKPEWIAETGKNTRVIFTSSQHPSYNGLIVAGSLEQYAIANKPLTMEYNAPLPDVMTYPSITGTQIAFSTADEGFIGKIDGVLLHSPIPILTLDISGSFAGHTYVLNNGQKYRTTLLQPSISGGWLRYPTRLFSFRVE